MIFLPATVEAGAYRRALELTAAEPERCSVRFIGSADVVQLFRTVLCTVRRRMESDMEG